MLGPVQGIVYPVRVFLVIFIEICKIVSRFVLLLLDITRINANSSVFSRAAYILPRLQTSIVVTFSYTLSPFYENLRYQERPSMIEFL